MRKRFIAIVSVVALVSLGAWWHGRAQSVSDPEMNFIDRMATLESKLDSFSTRQQSVNEEIRKKLDLILANQATIISQLEIVKIRATLK